jgi:ubiquinone/menaquinone biosynthesis C-methylase UbiE
MSVNNLATSLVERLQQYERVHEGHHRKIVDWLALPEGSRVLDAGCGSGGTTALLAQAVGARGLVAALDVKAEHLQATREAAAATAGAARVTYHECSLLEMPFADGEFDLVWCSRVIHHMPDQVAAVRALARVTRPGGRVVLREGGLAARFLPPDVGIGEPGLEDRLRVVTNQWMTQRVRHETDAHTTYPYGWTRMLRDAGCVNVSARSFLFEALPPFSADLMAYGVLQLRGHLTNPEIAPHVTPQDKQTLEALTDSNSPHYIARRSDLHWLSVSSVYMGWVPGRIQKS